MDKKKVLFVCVHNSARSQMAEAFLKQLAGDRFEVESAGLEPGKLNPIVVEVMKEAGIDISQNKTKSVFDFYKQGKQYDYVVTVCGHANETCPMWLRGKAKVVHVGFDDPPALAKGAKTEEEALAHYRRVRDEIRDFIKDMPGNLSRGGQETGSRADLGAS